MVAGSLSGFKVSLSAAPGAGQSWQAQIQLNGVLIPGATCTISNPLTPPHTTRTCTIAGPFAFTDGDRLVVFMDRVSGAVTATRIAFKANYSVSP